MSASAIAPLLHRLHERLRDGPPRPQPPDPAALGRALAQASARHAGLGQALAQLDEHQLAAVVSDDPVAVVQAHVGSGKTRVLTHKVLHLHLARGVPLEEIVVLTFTQRAAGELVARLRALLGDGAPGALARIGTFHAVARALLERSLPLSDLGYRPGFEVLDGGGRQELLEELAAANGLRVAYRRRLGQRIDRLRQGRTTFGNLRRPDDLPLLIERYGEEKRRRNVMDFDDLLAHATALLPAAPAPPRWVLVDELQDCEPRELAFVRRLRGPTTRLFAVGDPNQAIYGWRGSAATVFAELTLEPGARVYALPRSYRSSATILDGARALLPSRGGELSAARGPGAPIVIRRHHNPFCEALYLAERIKGLMAAGTAARDIAVLFRVRRQEATLRTVLADRGVPLARAGDEEAGADGVRLLTLHAAKGLEFRQVFVVGCNDGLVPLVAGGEPEERRLLYVGMTRAIDGLELSSLTEPCCPGAASAPSRFLSALPQAAVARDPPLVLARQAGTLRAGDAVRHPRYGRGQVVSVDGDHVRCDFGGFGARAFDVRLCPLAPA